jgi:N-acetylglucosamine-6-sulfatase
VAALALLLAGLSGVSPSVADDGTDPGTPTQPQADTRPNVVLITTDDQTLSDMKWMPRTRALLGDAGATYEHMLSPHPLCCPARAEMVTGQYAQNNGVHSNAGRYGGLQALRQPDNTLPAWLRAASYRTGMSGKYLNGYRSSIGVPNGWDFWNAATRNRYGYYGYQTYNNGVPLRQAKRGGEYSVDLVTDDTVGLVDQYAGSGSPFFLWASYYAPHGLCGGIQTECDLPPVPAKRYAHAWKGATNPAAKKPSFNEKDVSDKPPVIEKRGKVSKRYEQRLFKKRIQALAAVDEGVGRILDALATSGELDNTYVLFTSDNGYLLGEHRYQGKVLAYEESVRVPMLVRGPGVPAGSHVDRTVTTVDLASTVLQVTGATAGRPQDGHSLLDPASDPDRTVLIQAGPPSATRHPKPWMYRGVRTNRYTYVRWSMFGRFTELYDRRVDPYQLRNRAHDKRYQRIVRALARRTNALVDCSGAACDQRFARLPSPRRR